MSDANPRRSLRKSAGRSKTRGVKFGNANPYVNFVVESLTLPEYKTMNKREAFKILGHKWSRLSQQEREPYINIANEIKKKTIAKRDKGRDTKSRLAITKKIINRRSTPINEPLMPVKTKKAYKTCYKCGQKHGNVGCKRKVWRVGRRKWSPRSRHSGSDTSKTTMPSESDSGTTMTNTTRTGTTMFNSETSMSTF